MAFVRVALVRPQSSHRGRFAARRPVMSPLGTIRMPVAFNTRLGPRAFMKKLVSPTRTASMRARALSTKLHPKMVERMVLSHLGHAPRKRNGQFK